MRNSRRKDEEYGKQVTEKGSANTGMRKVDLLPKAAVENFWDTLWLRIRPVVSDKRKFHASLTGLSCCRHSKMVNIIQPF